jgi:hypothetical protein
MSPQSTHTFSRPGVVVSLFIPTPPDANAINIHESSSNTLEPEKLANAVVSLWSATGCDKKDADFAAAFECKDISRLPEHQVGDTKQLQSLLKQAETGESLMAAASGSSAKNHQAILQRQSDALSLRCNWCSENTHDDLATATKWAEALIAEAKKCPVFGLTCIYYFEFQKDDPDSRKQEMNGFTTAIRKQLMLPEHQSSIVSLFGKSVLSRIKKPGNVGTLGGSEYIFVAGIDPEQAHVNAFIENFFRARDYHQVPAGALYALAFEKICVHRQQAIQANLEAREKGEKIFAQLNVEAKKIKDGHDTNLADIGEKLEKLDNHMLSLREAEISINLNMELVADRTTKAFGIDVASIHSPTAFISEDLTLARQAQLQVGGFTDYLQLLSDRLNKRINFIRTQLEALTEKRQRLEFESHERLIERFHLLEVFIVTVYVLELPHIFEKLKESGLVLAAISMLIVLCFIFGLPMLRSAPHLPANGHPHRSGQGWSLRTVIACTLLIAMPYLWSSESFKNVWSSLRKSPTGIESKSKESPQKPNDH